MTEIASCGSFTKTDAKNKLGSVGIPLSKNIVKVLPRLNDPEKDTILIVKNCIMEKRDRFHILNVKNSRLQ